MTRTRERVAIRLFKNDMAHNHMTLLYAQLTDDEKAYWLSQADAAIRAMSEEVEAAYREGWLALNDCSIDLCGIDWRHSDARARLKEAGHD